MTAEEIIEKIKKLSPEERQEVFVFINGLKETSAYAHAGEVTPEFERRAEKIFDKNDELFRKLAE